MKHIDLEGDNQMVKLLIISDDFTGALDTGVQFAVCGATTRVVTNSGYKIENIDKSVQVLVIDAETRHMKAEDAYEVVYQIVKQARESGIRYIYKKTDSALRGNIGSELTAVIEAAGEQILHFLPALPRMNRITKNGVHYIEELPVHQSVFGQDPFEPVTRSYISEIIAQQSKIQVAVVLADNMLGEVNEPTIAVYDAETDEALQEIAIALHHKNQLHLMAGCAGLAAVLPKLLQIEGNKPEMPEIKNHFLVVCGSVNPITKDQLDFAEKEGFYRIRLTPEQKLSDEYMETEQGKKDLESWIEICLREPKCLLDTNDLPGKNDTLEYAEKHSLSLEEVRFKISSALGKIVKELVEAGVGSTLLLTGGDTLLGFMNQIQVYEMTPVGEIAPGTVLSHFTLKDKQYEVISKSGGFGEENLFVTLSDLIVEGKEEKVS